MKFADLLFRTVLVLVAIKIQFNDISSALPGFNFIYIIMLFTLPFLFGVKSVPKIYAYLIFFSFTILVISTVHFLNTGNTLAPSYAFFLLLMSLSSLAIYSCKIDLDRSLVFFFFISNVILIASLFNSVSLGHSRMDIAFGHGTATSAAFIGVVALYLGSFLKSIGRVSDKTLFSTKILAFVTITYSFSRSVFLAMIFLWFVKLLSSDNEKISFKKFINQTSFMIIIVTLMLSLVAYYSILKPQAFDFLIDKLSFSDSGNTGAGNRMLHVQFATQLLNDTQSWFFGTGFEYYRYAGYNFFESKKHLYTLHSAYLQYLVGVGLIGFSMLLIYFIILLRQCIKIKDEGRRELVFSLTVLSLTVAAFQPLILSKYLFFLLPLLIAKFIKY